MNDAARQITGGGLHERAAPASILSRGQRRALFVLPLTSAVFAVSALWSPTELPGFVLCPFRALTGLPCPGCGMTRAFCALSSGRFDEALSWNRGAPALYTLFWLWTAAALAYAFKSARRRK